MSMFFSVKNKLLNCKIKNDLQSQPITFVLLPTPRSQPQFSLPPLLIKFNQIVISNLICEKRERKKGKRLLPSGLSQIMRSCHKRIITRAWLCLKKNALKNTVSKMKSKLRTETSWMNHSPTEAGTYSGWMKSFSVHRLEDQCEEKVGYIFHQIRVQNQVSLIIQLYLSTSNNLLLSRRPYEQALPTINLNEQEASVSFTSETSDPKGAGNYSFSQFHVRKIEWILLI